MFVNIHEYLISLVFVMCAYSIYGMRYAISASQVHQVQWTTSEVLTSVVTTWLFTVRLHVEIWLFLPHNNDGTFRSPQLCFGWTIYMELYASIAVRPLSHSLIILLPVEDFSLRQIICFMSTLLIVITVRVGEHNLHRYIYTYCR